MEAVTTYLRGLQDKVFALLPMREEYDTGLTNHLEDYAANLGMSLAGVLVCYPELGASPELIEVQGTVVFLGGHPEMDFRQWRAAVLRSTRLIGNVLERRSQGGEPYEQ